jgi:hypothetical protein
MGGTYWILHLQVVLKVVVPFYVPFYQVYVQSNQGNNMT